MKFIIITLCLSSLTACTNHHGNITVSEITSIYDADTFTININDYPPIIGKRIPVRVNGVDAPEIRGKCESEKLAAQKAKQFTEEILLSAKVVELRNIKRGKYFRIIADVYVDGKSLTEELIKSGHARPYHGGKRLGWCE